MLIVEALIIRTMQSLDLLRRRVHERRTRRDQANRLKRAHPHGTHGEWL